MLKTDRDYLQTRASLREGTMVMNSPHPLLTPSTQSISHLANRSSLPASVIPTWEDKQASLKTASRQAEQGQRLPITAQVKIKGQIIRLEVARTPQQQAMGLMYRSTLPKNRGMLFPFDPPRSVQITMQNVPISLDIIFIRNKKVRAIVSNAPPCRRQQCPTYGARGAVDQVIELRGGRASELALQVRDSIRVRSLI